MEEVKQEVKGNEKRGVHMKKEEGIKGVGVWAVSLARDVTTEGLVDWHGCLLLVSEVIHCVREKD